MSRDYRKIIAWEKAHCLVLGVYEATGGFPVLERYGIVNQVRRAACSGPANIAEGAARDSHKDFLRFLYIALGSLKETDYFLLLSHDLGYLDANWYAELSGRSNEAIATLQGLITSVKRECSVFGRASASIFAWLTVAIGSIAA